MLNYNKKYTYIHIQLQNTGIPKEIFAASNKEQQRNLAHHQQHILLV